MSGGNKLIFPDILTDSMAELVDKVGKVQDFSSVVHVDVIDGMYANNLTIDVANLKDVVWGELLVDVHLMVQDPEAMLGELYTAGISRVLAQVERMHDIDTYLSRCEELSLKAGLGLDLYTPTAVVESVLEQVDVILVMSVKAGFSGQAYHSVVEKIAKLRSLGFEGDIVVDGGIDESVFEENVTAGANQFAVNSSLWQHEDAATRYAELTKELLKYG